MKCGICSNEQNNTPYKIREMMFGLRDSFDYFQCGNCQCIQIKEIPENLGKYYPTDYYSFASTDSKIKKLSYFKQMQYEYLSGNKKTILGAIISYKYKSLLYDWCNVLQLRDKNTKILDLGCGGGDLLKQLENLGFTNLTGADPFLLEDIDYSENIKIYKKSVYELSETYDVIMLHHSFEHMDNHAEVIQKLYQLLRKDGKLFIRIPIYSKPLFERYGVDLVNLDAPRHLFVHSIKSITYLLENHGFKITNTTFDANVFDIIVSEQYKKDITLFDKEKSYITDIKNSMFTPKEHKIFRKQMEDYNRNGEGSAVALVIEKAK
jgi:2-polyprenyl-3-methyl-5-hydroxy-6-metoxy-1,4-benzoquinol methylase